MSLVGAYLCPRGVFLVECRSRPSRLEVARTIDQPATLQSAESAAEHLVNALASAGIRKAEVAVAIRGFDVAYHVIGLPPAPEAMLAPIIDREVRRLEPQMTDAVIGWMSLPADESATPDQPTQKHVMVAACPRPVTEHIEDRLRAAGHTLLHLTALSAALQQLAEEFDATKETKALVVPLPDGPFLGFFLSGGLRLAVEPPLQGLDAPDSAAIAEEVELGAMFVRQQFRGAQIERVTIASPQSDLPDAEAMLEEKLGVPVRRLDLQGLSSSALAALGAVLDARSSHGLALAGTVGRRKTEGVRATVERASYAALAIAALVGAWTIYQAMTARRSAEALRDAQRRVEQESFGIVPLRETASRRKLILDAVSALQIVARDRIELQQMLGAIGSGVVPPVRMDSLQLDRGTGGWVASLAGSASAATNGRAVQALHDFYRDLPRRAVVEQLALESLAYADDSGDDGGLATVRFRISFVLPTARKE